MARRISTSRYTARFLTKHRFTIIVEKRLKSQFQKFDWTYALREVALIFVGVSIALGVNLLNQRRLDRQDEEAFLVRLHQEVLMAEELSIRVRERRLEMHTSLESMWDVVSNPQTTRDMSLAECRALGSLSFMNINLAGLPSYAELVSSGRLSILRNEELRVGLVGLEQIRTAIPMTVSQLEGNSIDLYREYPRLVTHRSYIDESTGEFRMTPLCDLEGMRKSELFKGHLAVGIDLYDVYVRDGLQPWFKQFDLIHRQLDEYLKIVH